MVEWVLSQLKYINTHNTTKCQIIIDCHNKKQNRFLMVKWINGTNEMKTKWKRNENEIKVE